MTESVDKISVPVSTEKDLYLKMPIGTTIIDVVTNQEITINEKNPSILLCKGGAGA